ncbi:DUF5985 family protein [Lysobacter yangpyeongensis]|jgi:hypothetical protein|uniref:DUF5985 family protein n=1 Tax=Lysobacter yangpyeongensis TaxID=346182 RepID=A0ABW0SR29_9GAMM
MIVFVYALCACTSLVCAVLLMIGARRTRSRMLLWASICFWLMTAANVVVILDSMVFRGVALWPVRHGLSLAAVCILVYGLIMEDR